MSIAVSMTPVQPKILPAREDQIDTIVSFQRSAIEAVPESYYGHRVKAAWWRTPAIGLNELITSGKYFVIALNGGLVAGAGWEPHREKGAAMLRAVFVDPAFSGLGLGVRAVKQVEAEVMKRGYETMIVPSALNATGFYKKLGYSLQQKASVEYEPGVMLDYLVMRKRLKGGA